MFNKSQSGPPSLLWLDSLKSIESTVRTLTFILPGESHRLTLANPSFPFIAVPTGRFQDAELVSEGLYCALNLLGVYRDHVHRVHNRHAGQPDNPLTASHFNRYTRHLLLISTEYRLLAFTLTLFRYSEVLMEMTAGRFCLRVDSKRWRLVLLIECIK
jgi:hypothetical protein